MYQSSQNGRGIENLVHLLRRTLESTDNSRPCFVRAATSCSRSALAKRRSEISRNAPMPARPPVLIPKRHGELQQAARGPVVKYDVEFQVTNLNALACRSLQGQVVAGTSCRS